MIFSVQENSNSQFGINSSTDYTEKNLKSVISAHSVKSADILVSYSKSLQENAWRLVKKKMIWYTPGLHERFSTYATEDLKNNQQCCKKRNKGSILI